jgi:predicted PurR-regulated permease PerM
MSPRSPLPLLSTPSEARTATLQGLLIATIVIGALYFGREILVPLALAILLSFVLTPPLLLLRRIKMPRVLAVGLVVGAAFLVIFAIGWLLSAQVTQLAGELPKFQTVLTKKVGDLSNAIAGAPLIKRAATALGQLEQTFSNPPPDTSVGAEPAPPQQVDQGKQPVPVEVRNPPPTPFEIYQGIAGTLLPPLATAGIVLLFVVFILLQREDLRDRLIRLLGASDLQRATSTITDAADRLSHYFLRQVLINSAYGVFITVALWLIGIPTPIVWGVLAGLMRFVPFIGSYIAALPPLLVAAVVYPDWSVFLMTLALYVVSEVIMGQVVEPLVFGHGTGVTPIAVVASTIFWTWLWGPLGLLLAMPITVCLAVLGRHVEGLEFFEVLLGDQPALTHEQSFYHRALTGDAAEATYQAELTLKERSLVSYLDSVVLSGLKLAEYDARRGSLDSDKAKKVCVTVKEMLDNLADFEPRSWFAKLRKKPEKAEKEGVAGFASLHAARNEEDEEADENGNLPVIDRSELAPGWVVDEPVLCVGGRNVLDEAAADVLAEVLKKRGIGASSLGPKAISAGHITSLANTEAKLIALSYLGLGTGPAHIRYLVRRLRRILPEGTLILVCFWAEAPESPSVKALLATTDADAYATSLSEAVEICLSAARGELQWGATGGAHESKGKPAAKSEAKRKRTPARVAWSREP